MSAPLSVNETIVIPENPPLGLEIPASADGRKRWTRTDFVFLENACLLKERYELIDGEIISKMGHNSPHAIAVINAIAYCLSLTGKLQVRSQATLEVRQSDRTLNRPEPDVVVLRPDAPRRRVPQGDEAILLIEICDTTHDRDLGAKVGLYARAGVGEYWVLDIPGRRLIVYRPPLDRTIGDWQPQEYVETDTIAPLFFPGKPICVSDLLPEEEIV